MSELLSINDLSVAFPLHSGTVHALHDVQLTLEHLERLALVGETGSGKSVLGHAIVRLLPETAKVHGSILYKEHSLLELSPKQVRKFRGREIALVVQNPNTSLNPMLNTESQLKESIKNNGSGDKNFLVNKIKKILANVGLGEAIRYVYPHQLSGGMKQRVLFSVGLALEPRLLIVDEPTKGLDNLVRAEIIELIEKSTYKQRAMIVITHDLPAAKRLSDTIAIMYAGNIVEYGPTHEVFKKPYHPYTKGLFESHPSRGIKPIPGMAPSLMSLPAGCSFAPRCSNKTSICDEKAPPLIMIQAKRRVRCFHVRG